MQIRNHTQTHRLYTLERRPQKLCILDVNLHLSTFITEEATTVRVNICDSVSNIRLYMQVHI